VDGNNCSSDALAVTVVFPNPLTIELDPSETAFICEGDEITIEAELGGGVGFPAPVWTTLSNGQQISNQTSFTDIPEDDEGYVVTVTDGCAVPVTDTVFVVVNDTPEVLISYDAFEGCAPVEVQLINMTDENLVGSCLWQFGDGNILAACVDTVNYLFANPGEFTVSLTITSPDGCIGYGEMDAEVEVYPYPVANFTWSPNPPSNLENQIQLINQTQGGNTFFWDFDYLGTSPSPNPILELPPVDFGFFPVCLTATNIYGCTDSICENIVLQGVQLIYVPNAFTPDGDGRNDVFLPIVSGIDRSDYVFRIFDRWGQKIFETEKTDEPWLGNINGGGHYVQNDVYVWQIITKDLISGESKDYVGHVTIVR
jgi:gliding motility-associated-like protein